jgi:hypothetical protein
MRIDDSLLYEQFVAARVEAVALTDIYRETAADDPRRGVLWEAVVRQTESARVLLESWLYLDQAAETAASRDPEHSLQPV